MPSIFKTPKGTLVVTVRLTLRPSSDDALIEYILNARKGSLAPMILGAMRNGISDKRCEVIETEIEEEFNFEQFEVNL
jgi:hypothetical protein